MRSLLSLISVLVLLSQFSSSYSQVIPFDSERWQIEGAENRLEDYLGQKSLLLKGGIAYIKDSEFGNGILEFDVAFSSDRGFMGGVWRLQDLLNYEEFYIRPHQSGNPDANQYTPVFNGLSGWQLYHGEGYGAPIKYSYEQWLHVKIVVSGNQAEIYIVDMEKPALFIPELKREIKSGKVGVKASNFAPAHFANFSFMNIDKPDFKTQVEGKKAGTENNIKSYSVSNNFDPKILDGLYELDKSEMENHTWTDLVCEASGLTNLARVLTIERGKNCAFVRVTIVSEKEQIKGLEFGYSDAVQVFLNSRMIYGGTNLYRSRDYRYLGTIGYFDKLYLPLQKGENEVWFAVTENFGGWGLQARFENLEGISIGRFED